MLLRRIARPLFASWFVSEGYDAARRPEVHAERARAGLERVVRLVPPGALGGALDRYRHPTTTRSDRDVRVLVDTEASAFATVIEVYAPDDIGLLARVAEEHHLQIPEMDTTYFLGRETLIVTSRESGMATWREKIFASMMRNAESAARFFRLPPNRVVELGAQIEF